MPIPQFKLKDSKPDRDFIEWNEEMSHKQDIDLFYEGSHYFVRWVEEQRLKTITGLIKRHMKKNNIVDPIIVEAGCGTGHVLEEIADSISTSNLIGVDPLEWWLDKATKRLGDRAKLVKGFAEELPFGDKSVDFVICTEVIEHVIDPAVVLCELKRVVKDEGLIVVSIPNEKLINRLKDVVEFFKIYQRLFSNIPRRNDDEWHLHSFDLKSFKKCIPSNLSTRVVIPVPLVFLPLRYVLTFN